MIRRRTDRRTNMSERAPVSVIIPCFRCEGTIARAVESVIGQTLPPAEILLVEDGSADGGKTLDALRKLQRKHGDGIIKVVLMDENGGVAAARNRGWDAASQPYIAFLDADDAWHPEKLQIQHRWLAAHPEVDFCGHQIRFVSSAAEIGNPLAAIDATRIGQRSWLFSCRFSGISVMLRRSLPFRFAPGKRYAEDYELWLRIALSGHDAWRIEAPLAFCFKPLYGAGGLTKSLWAHEKGELDAYRRICREGLISRAAFVALAIFSLLKYLRRLMLATLRSA